MQLRLVSAVACVWCLAATARAGEIAVAVTAPSLDHPGLVLLLDTDAPSLALRTLPLAGLAVGELPTTLDLRTATGELWLRTNQNRMLVLDPQTGRTSQVGAAIDATLLGSLAVGADFSPTADRLRLVDTLGANLRYNPFSSLVVDSDPGTAGSQVDTSLAFDVGDADAGQTPAVSALAYDRNDTDAATATTLYGIDAELDLLVRVGGEDSVPSANGGVLFTVGALGVDVAGDVSFDIAPGSSPAGNGGKGAAFFVAQPAAGGAWSLYSVRLVAGAGGDAGAATSLGAITSEPVGGFTVLGGGALQVDAASASAERSSPSATLTVLRLGEALTPVSVAYRTVDGTARAGEDYTAVEGVLYFADGEAEADIEIPLLADDLPADTKTLTLVLGPAAGGAVVLTELTTVALLGAPQGGGCNQSAAVSSWAVALCLALMRRRGPR